MGNLEYRVIDRLARMSPGRAMAATGSTVLAGCGLAGVLGFVSGSWWSFPLAVVWGAAIGWMGGVWLMESAELRDDRKFRAHVRRLLDGVE